MRLFAIGCFAVAIFYGYTAVDAMRTGVTHSLGGKADVEQRRDEPQSRFARFLFARWMYAGGFATLGAVMLFVSGRFEKLEADANK